MKIRNSKTVCIPWHVSQSFANVTNSISQCISRSFKEIFPRKFILRGFGALCLAIQNFPANQKAQNEWSIILHWKLSLKDRAPQLLPQLLARYIFLLLKTTTVSRQNVLAESLREELPLTLHRAYQSPGTFGAERLAWGRGTAGPWLRGTRPWASWRDAGTTFVRSRVQTGRSNADILKVVKSMLKSSLV